MPSAVELRRLVRGTADNNDRWHQSRRGKISASRVGAALGYDDRSTPQKCAIELLHGPQPVNPYLRAIMDRGNEEEPLIRAVFRRLMEGTATVLDPMGTFESGCLYSATPDGFLLYNGNSYVVEYKRKESYPSQPSAAHVLQVWMQCHVTGCKGGYLFYVTPHEGWALWTLDYDAIPLQRQMEWLLALQEFADRKERIATTVVRQTGRAARQQALLEALTNDGALVLAGRWRGQVYDSTDGAILFTHAPPPVAQ